MDKKHCEMIEDILSTVKQIYHLAMNAVDECENYDGVYHKACKIEDLAEAILSYYDKKDFGCE